MLIMPIEETPATRDYVIVTTRVLLSSPSSILISESIYSHFKTLQQESSVRRDLPRG